MTITGKDAFSQLSQDFQAATAPPMGIDAELALIHKKPDAPQTQPEAPSSAPADAPPPAKRPDPEAGLPPPETGLPSIPGEDVGFWDTAAASWQAETVKTDAWNYTEKLRQDQIEAMWRELPPEARQRIADQKFDQANNWMKVEDLVTREIAAQAATSADNAARLGHFPQTPEAFAARIDEQRKAALSEASDILDTSDHWFADFLGSAARATTDETSLMLLPFGVSGTAWRMIAGEAILGAVGEAAILPREFQVAKELDLQTPEILPRLLTGAAMGGGLSAIAHAIGRGIVHWQSRRAGAEAGIAPGADRFEAEAQIDATEAQMRGDRTVSETLAQRGTLGDILAAPKVGRDPASVSVEFELVGKIRDKPLSDQFEANLRASVAPLGDDIGVRIVSGGQDAIGTENAQRTGGTRHDVDHSGHGHTADVVLTRNGKPVLPEQDRELYARFFAQAGQYFPGMGHYSWGVHVGGGSVASWGPDTTSHTLDPYFGAAMAAGRKGAAWRGGGLENTPGLSYNEDATLAALIGAESSGNATARNSTSSAAGLGQILSDTWMELVQKHRPDLLEGRTPNQVLQLRDDPALNAELTKAYMRDNHSALKGAGVPAGPGEIYLAHFMGPTGAIGALKADLETPITQLMGPKKIADNKGIRYRGKAFAEFTNYDLQMWAKSKMASAYSGGPAGVGYTGPTSRGYTGNGEVTAGDGFKINVQYVVVDAATLTRASGDLQPRDRSRGNSDAWIADTAARLDPAQLMAAPTADRGAPIIGPDNVIESGNGRYGAIMRAYERHPDRAAAYVQAIKDQGYAVPEGVTQPILVARRTSELTHDERVRFAIEAQDSGVAVMTPTEMARANASAMTGDVLGKLDPAQSLAHEANGGFVRAALGNLPRSARNAMFDADGRLNRLGERQLREALFARAWSDPDIIEMFTEADAGELRSLLDALEASVPNWAALKADIEAGLVAPEMDISGHVLDAMRLIATARKVAAQESARRGKAGAAYSLTDALNELLDEVDLLAGPVAPLTTALVRKFWHNGRAAPADKVGSFLTRYADEARQAGRLGGMLDTPGPREVLQTIDPVTFKDLPEDLGAVRGFARPNSGAPQAVAPDPADPITGFDQGATSPEAIEGDAATRAELVPPAPAAEPQTAGAILGSMTADGPRQLVDLQRLAQTEQDALGRGLKEAQPYDTAQAVYDGAVKNHDALNDRAAEVAADLGLEFKRAPVKKLERITSKVEDKYQGNYRKIADVARTGITAPTMEAAEAFVRGLAERFHVIDEGWITTPAGYFDRKLMVRFDDGQLGEIQVWPPGMLAAKGEGGGHKLYEVSRDPAQPEAVRAQATADMITLYGRVAEGLDPSFAAKLGFDAPRAASSSVASASESSTARSSLNTSSASAREPSGGDQVPLSPNNLARPSSDTAAISDTSNFQNFMGDRPSVSQDKGNIGTGPADVKAPAPVDDLAAFRGTVGDFEIELADGTTARVSDLIADMDADEGFDAFVQACGLIPGGAQ